MGRNLARLLQNLDYKFNYLRYNDDKMAYVIYFETDQYIERDDLCEMLSQELISHGFCLSDLDRYKDNKWFAFVWVRLEE